MVSPARIIAISFRALPLQTIGDRAYGSLVVLLVNMQGGRKRHGHTIRAPGSRAARGDGRGRAARARRPAAECRARVAPPEPERGRLALFFLMLPLPPRSTLFPYTTLFRSVLIRRSSWPSFVLGRIRPREAVQGDWQRHESRMDEPARIFLPRRQRRSRVDRELDDGVRQRSEEHTSELQSQSNLVCRLLLEK